MMNNTPIRRPALLALTAITLVAAGCATKAPAPAAAAQCLFRGTEEVAPNWVCEGNTPPEGYALSAVNNYEKSNAGYNFMLAQAAAQARASLAANLQVDIKQKVESWAAQAQADANKMSQGLDANVTRQEVAAILQGAKILRTANTKGGDLWVQVGIDKASYERAGKEVLKTALNKDPALLKQFQDAKAEAAKAQAALGKPADEATRGNSRDAIISDIMKVGS